MSWVDFQHQQGAILAPDDIPLQYQNLITEYHAALERAVLMDRSHEGRIEIQGRSRLDLIQRISTNDVLAIPVGAGQATIFTNANGRILDRVMIYNQGETTLLTTEAGRSGAVRSYLQRQVFFNDDFHMLDLASSTRLFALHGLYADSVVQSLTGLPSSKTESPYRIIRHSLSAGIEIILAQRKSLSGSHWAIVVPQENAEIVWLMVMEAGKSVGLIPAGSLTYNTLRIRAGRPAAGHELSTDFIPLEAGLWDEVSFTKGCYTGQEIIARMESRNRLAKTMVKLRLSQMIEAPAPLFHEGKAVGTLTSSVSSPDGELFGIGFVKTTFAEEGKQFTVGESAIEASINALAGVQPPQMAVEQQE